jgi:hypothetical protein
VLAFHARTPQQQLAWRNGVIARARALGLLKGGVSATDQVKALRAQAQGLRARAAAGEFQGYLTRDDEDVAKDLEEEAKEVAARGETGMSIEDCMAFSALAARMPTDQLTVFCLAHKGSKFASSCYSEASLPKWNVVRFLTHEENAKLTTVSEALATGAALPGLLSVAAGALAAAAAKSRAPAPKAAPAKAAKALSLRERYQAHGRTLSLESKLRWTRRVFSHLHPNWTQKWSGDYSREHGETLRDQVKEHFYCLAQVAHEDYEDARKRIARCWFRPYATSAPTWDLCEQQLAARRDARAETKWELQLALNGEYLSKRFPTFCAIMNWGRGSLVHPAVAARKKGQKRAKRANAATRAAQEAAAVRALPAYITAVAPEAYSRPMEEIRSISFKNLPLATTLVEQAALRQALSDFVTRVGATVAKVRGALFVPTQGRGGPTKGFGFVECSTAEGARRVVDAAAEDSDLLFNGVTSKIFVELAASNRQTKDQMEAKKAADAKERESARAKVLSLMKAEVGPKATPMELVEAPAAAAPALAKVCLGATARARREAEEAAEAARLRAEVEAMFSAPLGGTVRSKPKAPQYKLSFAAAAVKPAAPKVEVVDAFTAKVGGKVVAVTGRANTELGAAQAMMRKIMAESEAKEKKAKRDKAYAQWLADKAAADADPMGWDIEEWVEPE